MSYFDKLDRANELLNGMADRMGADFAAAVTADAESVTRYRTAVIRCANCAEPEACKGWQIEHDTATDTPAYCRNRDLLKAMSTV